MISLTRQKGVILQLREDNAKRSNVNAQRGFTGHTIYFPQDTQFIATILPPPVDELLKYICILFVGLAKPSREFLVKHARPLAVRPDKVRQALVWLKANNILYRDIIINDQALAEIEQNDGIPFVVEHVDQSVVNDEALSGYFSRETNCAPSSENDFSIPLERLVIADLNVAPTTAEMRAAAIRHLQHGKPYLQIGHGRTPETDYHNHTLFPSMYPTLYPYGYGGFEDPSRSISVGFAAQLKHLLSLSDRRFQTHPSFMFTAFNILQRREVLRRTSMQIKRADFEHKARLYARLSPETIHCVSQKVANGDYSADPGTEE
ncbi:hypothetical protein F5887DRAFT_888761 [Amanita rubescens]|nr:hypothetical protein F5887DRAFT_888761 [Amanita rubescens]